MGAKQRVLIKKQRSAPRFIKVRAGSFHVTWSRPRNPQRRTSEVRVVKFYWSRARFGINICTLTGKFLRVTKALLFLILLPVDVTGGAVYPRSKWETGQVFRLIYGTRTCVLWRTQRCPKWTVDWTDISRENKREFHRIESKLNLLLLCLNMPCFHGDNLDMWPERIIDLNKRWTLLFHKLPISISPF